MPSYALNKVNAFRITTEHWGGSVE